MKHHAVVCAEWVTSSVAVASLEPQLLFIFIHAHLTLFVFGCVVVREGENQS